MTNDVVAYKTFHRVYLMLRAVSDAVICFLCFVLLPSLCRKPWNHSFLRVGKFIVYTLFEYARISPISMVCVFWHDTATIFSCPENIVSWIRKYICFDVFLCVRNIAKLNWIELVVGNSKFTEQRVYAGWWKCASIGFQSNRIMSCFNGRAYILSRSLDFPNIVLKKFKCDIHIVRAARRGPAWPEWKLPYWPNSQHFTKKISSSWGSCKIGKRRYTRNLPVKYVSLVVKPILNEQFKTNCVLCGNLRCRP